MGKSTISMAMFNSFLLVYQRVNLHFPYGFPMVFPLKPPFPYGFPMGGEENPHRCQVRNELFEGRRPSCRSICDWKLPLFAAQLGWIHGVLIGNWVDIHTIYIYIYIHMFYLFIYFSIYSFVIIWDPA